MTDLLNKLQAAEAGDRELDAEVAASVLGWRLWRSKHGHWHVDGPDGEHFEHGEPTDWEFDPVTGKKLPEPSPPTDWVERAEIPEFTTSLDAALALAERVLPGCCPGVSKNVHHKDWYAWIGDKHEEGPLDLGNGRSATPALALCAALIAAKDTGEGG